MESTNYLPKEFAKKLYELGYKEKSNAFFHFDDDLDELTIGSFMNYKTSDLKDRFISPLWDDAEDWFRLEKGLYLSIVPEGSLYKANIYEVPYLHNGNRKDKLVFSTEPMNINFTRYEGFKKMFELCNG